MNKAWFKEWGWIYYPVSWQGWGLLVLAIIFCTQVFIAVDSHSHSASDTLYGVFPYVVPALLLLEWAASRTSGGRQQE